MAKAVTQAPLGQGLSNFTPSLRAVYILRISLGILIAVGAAISLIGTSWDIQWHSFVGRDRTLIPPHLMMLSGIAISGILALLSVSIESLWVRRNQDIARYSTTFAGLFSGSTGAYLAGFAALNAAIAFPMDNYWHALYGIDVAIWAPFHIMILVGMALMPLGACYMLASAQSMAQEEGLTPHTRTVSWSIVFALATMLGIFTLMLIDGTDDQFLIPIGVGNIMSFPFISCFMIGFTFTLARAVLPWRFAVTRVIAVYLLFGLIFAAFVPPMTGLLVTLEGLQYRKRIAQYAYLSVVAMRGWPLMPLIVAPLFDLLANRAKAGQWSMRRFTIAATLVLTLAAIPVAALIPLALPQLIQDSLGLIGGIISIALGVIGAYLGIIFARASHTALSSELKVAGA